MFQIPMISVPKWSGYEQYNEDRIAQLGALAPQSNKIKFDTTDVDSILGDIFGIAYSRTPAQGIASLVKGIAKIATFFI